LKKGKPNYNNKKRDTKINSIFIVDLNFIGEKLVSKAKAFVEN
jgi:hypothetical protein